MEIKFNPFDRCGFAYRLFGTLFFHSLSAWERLKDAPRPVSAIAIRNPAQSAEEEVPTQMVLLANLLYPKPGELKVRTPYPSP
jgi:hypothetical protein